MQIILNIIQFNACLSFLLAGIMCFIMGRLQYGCINVTLFIANTLIFFGDKIFK